MSDLLAAALGLFLQTAPTVGPGVYCAYDAVDLVSPAGEVRTVVGVETVAGKTSVAFMVTWPHSQRILTGQGEARAAPEGLTFDFTDGWGNRVRGALTMEGDLSFEMLEPPPSEWAAQVRIYMYSSATVTAGACRTGDADVVREVRTLG